MGIHVNNVSKNFRTFAALKDVSLAVPTGELVALLGPSGSGKTTLLRIIAGLEFPDSGTILMDGQETQDTDARARGVGFVFQHYALFKHMTVFDNVAFGLRVRHKHNGYSESVIRQKVLDLLSLVHLDAFHTRYPHELSGGQRQRVALARALAVEPKVLLLDEPFGALDAKVRQELRRWLRRLHDEVHITSLFVTHDQEEAMEVADRVVVMQGGKIEQIGTPAEVYHQPSNAFVYDFLGNYNTFEGWQDADGTLHLTMPDAPSAETPITATEKSHRWPRWLHLGGKKEEEITKPRSLNGKKVTVFARPHEMEVSKQHSGQEGWMEAVITHINAASPLVKMELRHISGQILQVEIPKNQFDEMTLQKGASVAVKPKNMRVFG